MLEDVPRGVCIYFIDHLTTCSADIKNVTSPAHLVPGNMFLATDQRGH